MANRPSATKAPLVLVSDLAHELGSWDVAQSLIEQARVRVVQDWSGRPALETETAAQILSAGRAAQAASAAKQASYDRYLSSREIERRDVGNAAFRSAHDDRLRTELRGWNSEDKRITSTSTMPLSPQGLSAAREAHAEALREYDRKHRTVPFDEFKG